MLMDASDVMSKVDIISLQQVPELERNNLPMDDSKLTGNERWIDLGMEKISIKSAGSFGDLVYKHGISFSFGDHRDFSLDFFKVLRHIGRVDIDRQPAHLAAEVASLDHDTPLGKGNGLALSLVVPRGLSIVLGTAPKGLTV
jgi:hypothetical protein